MTMPVAEKVKAEILEAATQITASGNTASSLDLRGIAHQGIQVEVTVAAALDDANFFEFKLQHSDDDSVFTDVDYADVKSTASGAVGDILNLEYEGVKRYLRLAYVMTGTSDITVNAVGLLMPEHQPVGSV